MRIPLLTLLFLIVAGPAVAAAPLPGFHNSPWFQESVRETWLEGSVHAVMNLPSDFDPGRPTRLIVFATPNGNTVEQTLGCRFERGADWHVDIQHVAAQTRLWRRLNPDENIALACVAAEGLSWPAWRKERPEYAAAIARIVETLRGWLPSKPTVTLACHSGGGSFLFGFINSAEAIPGWIDRIVFLDANYSYDDEQKHGDKLLAWLRGDASRRLIVIAYDDREIVFDGKKVVSETGGTYRATGRMRTRFEKDVSFTEQKAGDFNTASALGGQLVLHVHPNPHNKILHTVMVGEMNGLLEGLSSGTDRRGWGSLAAPRAYQEFVQPAPGIPARPAGAAGGRAVLESVAHASREAREQVLVQAVLEGNIPDFLRPWAPVDVEATDTAGQPHRASYEVLPDYLAVGSDDDFVRIPISPQSAQTIADAFGATLPTRKMVEDITEIASIRLTPRPLTADRESVAAFVKHNDLIEEQRGEVLRSALLAGIKKDVVLTNRLSEKPNRVAIFGWHFADGTPIQPLTIVHVNWYVDYSHGIRLVKRAMTVDGKPRDLKFLLHDARLHPLVSDEGVMEAGY
ncbi:hypothetical protein Pan44_40890 [Caulifigura coniformis]|uniref:Alpha/beta hydrolase family protein n=1 Tax=Caulifigura coniformis TaxID=2527983 RepID=A0A517SIW1_9PLAN|nr:hypothetical protein [Caulifigura coniformis]QDT56039.1 hypothetical protein Pan44_40890 [Caulifigura coniformis]